MTLTNPYAERLRRDGSAFSRHLGMTYRRVDAGVCEADLTLTDALTNITGGLHGGAAFALIDASMGAAIYSLLTAEETAATLEAKINYLRPVTAGLVRCRAQVIHKGRRTAVLEAELYTGDKLAAKASGTFAILRPED